MKYIRIREHLQSMLSLLNNWDFYTKDSVGVNFQTGNGVMYFRSKEVVIKHIERTKYNIHKKIGIKNDL